MVPSPAEASDALTVAEAVQVCVRWFRNAPRGFALVAVDSESERREFSERLCGIVKSEEVVFIDLSHAHSPQDLIEAMIAQLASRSAVIFGGLGQGFKATMENVHVLNVNRERLASFGARQLWVVTPALRRALQETGFDLYSWFMPNVRVARGEDLEPVFLNTSSLPSMADRESIALSPDLAKSQAESLIRRFRTGLNHSPDFVPWTLLNQALSVLFVSGLYGDANRLLDEVIQFISDRLRVPEDQWQTAVASMDVLSLAATIRFMAGKSAEVDLLYRQALCVLDKGEPLATNTPEYHKRFLARAHVLAQWKRSKGDEDSARESVDEFERLLSEIDRNEVPFLWARISGYLGAAYAELARLTGESEQTRKAIFHLTSELELLSKEKNSGEWASAQGVLGLALILLGWQKHDEAALNRAIEAFKASLTVLTRERETSEWAMVTNNLGNAYRLLGQLRNDQILLAKASSTFESTLSVWDRDQSPGDWTTVRNNYASSLLALDNTVAAKQAVEIYREIENWLTETSAPHAWARIQTNLALGYLLLARMEKDPNALIEARNRIECAMTKFASLGENADVRRAGAVLVQIDEMGRNWGGSSSSNPSD